MRKVFGIAVAGALAAALVGAVPAAFAAPKVAAAPVVTRGHCSGSSTWKLTLKFDNGRVESDVEVQTPAAGQAWHFVMRDNGVRFGSGNKTTLADGSWSATRYAANQAGPDNIVVRSQNTVTGEICRSTGTR